MKLKDKKIVLILGIIGIILILAGVTYALFYTNLLGIRDNVINYGDNIVFSYNEGANGISLSANEALKSDNDGKIQDNYFSFSVSLQTSKPLLVNYRIYITEDPEYSSIDNNYIKMYLTDDSNSLIQDVVRVGDLTAYSANSYVLYNGQIRSNNNIETEKSFRLRVWVSDDVNLDNTYSNVNNDGTHSLVSDDFVYKFKVNAEAIQNIDESGANEPDLATGMIPVYYDSTNDVWRKADVTNTNPSYQWYSYASSGATKGMWANAVTVADTSSETSLVLADDTTVNCANATCVRSDYIASPNGTIIPMSDINTMWVWIPRFTVNKGELTTQAYFESIRGTATGICSDTTYTTESDCTLNSGTWTNNYLSPEAINVAFVDKSTVALDAFWWDEDSDGVQDTGEQKSGFWYGKFETSSDIACTASDYSAVGEGCNVTTIKPKIIPNVTSWRGAQIATFFTASRNMEAANNMYGFIASEVDTHMSKNNEWGAVAYLTQSIYGRCSNSTTCTEVGINNNSYITGMSDYITNINQSTTGTIYGIYDMSGGSWEYVMGNFNNNIGSSGFGSMPSSKYYNLYTGTSYIGHALSETSGWYSDDSHFVGSNGPWFLRGGVWDSTSGSGVFAFGLGSGNAVSNYGSRFALVK